MEIDEDVMDDDEEEEEEEEEPRSEVRRKMSHLVQIPQVKHFLLEADYAFYQKLVSFLMPKVLKSIPNNLTQAIRNLAKSLEGWMVAAMLKAPEHLRVIKVTTVKSLSQALRRYTGLNHLAQAARAVLQNGSHISQMLSDLNRVDFANVQEQASWVCQCDTGLVLDLESEFKKTLEEQCGLEGWALWLESVVDRCLKPHQGRPEFPKTARKFLMKWSFYSSMIIRDLTLRSAASFGSFHLIRLLYDEYMFYLVEHKVAKEIGQTPVAVMMGREDTRGTEDSSQINGIVNHRDEKREGHQRVKMEPKDEEKSLKNT